MPINIKSFHTIQSPVIHGMTVRSAPDGSMEVSIDGGKTWQSVARGLNGTYVPPPIISGSPGPIGPVGPIGPSSLPSATPPAKASPDPFGDAVRAAQELKRQDDIIPHPVKRPETKAEIDALWASIVEVGRGT